MNKMKTYFDIFFVNAYQNPKRFARNFVQKQEKIKQMKQSKCRIYTEFKENCRYFNLFLTKSKSINHKIEHGITCAVYNFIAYLPWTGESHCLSRFIIVWLIYYLIFVYNLDMFRIECPCGS